MVYENFKTQLVYNGHKWTWKLGKLLFPTIEHFCKLVPSFIARSKLLTRDDVEDYDLLNTHLGAT